jgi:O-antigen/teichoic acid export membrane protein
MSLLGNSYLKSLRKEAKMLKFNFISFLLSTFLCILFIVYFKDLNLAVASILFVYAFRSIITEFYLTQLLKIKILHNIMIELFITIAFIATGWLFSLLLGAMIFIVLYLLLTFIFRKQIMNSFAFFKNH